MRKLDRHCGVSELWIWRGLRAAEEFADGPRQVAVTHQRDHHVGGGAAVGHRNVDVLHVRADAGDDLRHLGAAVGPGAAVDVNPDGAIEFANAIGLVANRQFGAECGLEEAFGDLGVGESPALGGAPAADLGIFGLGAAGHQAGKRERDNGGGPHGGDTCAKRCRHQDRRSRCDAPVAQRVQASYDGAAGQST